MGWGAGDDPSLSPSFHLPSPIFSLSITGATERGWNRAGGPSEARHHRGDRRGTKRPPQQSGVACSWLPPPSLPQSAFQSARNRQRIHDIHTRKVGYCLSEDTWQMSIVLYLHDGVEVLQSISAISPLFARVFGQFSFPMPISLFKPTSQHSCHIFSIYDVSNI